MMLGEKTMHFVLAGFLVKKMSSETSDSNEICPTYAANQRAVFDGFFRSFRLIQSSRESVFDRSIENLEVRDRD